MCVYVRVDLCRCMTGLENSGQSDLHIYAFSLHIHVALTNSPTHSHTKYPQTNKTNKQANKPDRQAGRQAGKTNKQTQLTVVTCRYSSSQEAQNKFSQLHVDTHPDNPREHTREHARARTHTHTYTHL